MQTPQLHMHIDANSELRLLEERDAEDFFRLIDQNRIALREWLPWVDYTRTVEDELSFIRATRAQYAASSSFACGIWYRGQAAGTISYHPVDWANRKVEIGYWLGTAFQGKGLMTKACRLLVNYAFNDLRLNKVEIRAATGNFRSQAIPRRLGFKQEGIIRQGEWLYDHFVDLVLFGMLSSEWG
jgi:ribosomal-protein-serine acetyltransferase